MKDWIGKNGCLTFWHLPALLQFLIAKMFVTFQQVRLVSARAESHHMIPSVIMILSHDNIIPITLPLGWTPPPPELTPLQARTRSEPDPFLG